MCLFKVYVAQVCGHPESPIKIEPCPYDNHWWYMFSQRTPILSRLMILLKASCQAATITKYRRKLDYCYYCDEIMRQTLAIHKKVARERHMERIAQKRADEVEEAQEAYFLENDSNLDPILKFKS